MTNTITVYHRFIIFFERIECVIEHRIHDRYSFGLQELKSRASRLSGAGLISPQ